MVQRAASATAQLLVVKAWSSMITNLDYSRKEPRRMMYLLLQLLKHDHVITDA